ncbi:MAG: hypothetical protein QXS96_08665, partial [Candidatus Caldarchaeum sp.]
HRVCALRPASVGPAGMEEAPRGGGAGLAADGGGGPGGRAEPSARRGETLDGALAADEMPTPAVGKEEPTRAAPTPSGPTQRLVA